MASKSSSTVINLGSQRVSLASIVGGSKGALALTRYHHHDLEGDPSEDATRMPRLQGAVKTVVDAAKVKGSLVRCAIAGQPVFMRFVTLPPLSEDRVDKIVEFEAQQNVPFPIDEVSWGYQLIGEPGSTDVEVLLGAIKSDELSSMNSAVERSGVKTISVDVSPMLVYNAYRHNYADETEPVLVLDIGARTANLIYAEPGKVFISSSRIGGASFTQAIAKELDIPFAAAEQLKLQKGAINIGAEEPADEQAGAISSVLRNSVTRLHGEIVRTNNRYRSQQGGNIPTKVYLAGRAAGTPYLAHFLQEKLGVPVEYFNPLRNVGIGPKVNQEQVAAEAHTMGELVGLALRNGASSPIELELVPESLANARDLEKRKPALILGVVGLLSALAAGAFYFTRAAQVVADETDEVNKKKDALQEVQRGIDATKKEIAAEQKRTAPYTDTVLGQSYWVEFLADLNSRVKHPEVWFTSIEPRIKVTNNLTNQIGSDAAAAMGARFRGMDSLRDRIARDNPGPPAKKGAKPEPLAIDTVFVRGQYRAPASGVVVSEDLVNELRESPYFDLSKDAFGNDLEISDIADVEPNDDDSVWSYNFALTLPLKQPLVIENTTASN